MATYSHEIVGGLRRMGHQVIFFHHGDRTGEGPEESSQPIPLASVKPPRVHPRAPSPGRAAGGGLVACSPQVPGERRGIERERNDLIGSCCKGPCRIAGYKRNDGVGATRLGGEPVQCLGARSANGREHDQRDADPRGRYRVLRGGSAPPPESARSRY